MMKNLCVYLQTASPNFNLHPPPSPLAPVYGEKLNLFLQRLLISKHNLRGGEPVSIAAAVHNITQPHLLCLEGIW